MIDLSEKRVVLFLKKVQKSTLCWEWIGCISVSGYGAFGWQKTNGTSYRIDAHRYSWWLHKGPIKKGLFVLHKCDNKICVNPDHLFLGTQGDNNRDRAAKGRSRNQWGKNNNMYKHGRYAA